MTTKTSESKELTYTPLGESEPIRLTIGMVRNQIAVPTKSGAVPTDGDILRFMMLCKASECNPWAGDAYLVGYDSRNGPVFQQLISISAMFKRAEASPHFDGIESGVIVERDNAVDYRQGDLVFEGEKLLGGWARLHRKDCNVPFYDALDLKVFSTGRSRWMDDPAGMVVKCAEASVLRKAFPTQLGAAYTRQEMEAVKQRDSGEQVQTFKASDLLSGKLTTGSDAEPDESPRASQSQDSPLTSPDVAPTRETDAQKLSSVRTAIKTGLLARDAVEKEGNLIDATKAEELDPCKPDSIASDAWRRAFTLGIDDIVVASTILIDSQTDYTAFREAILKSFELVEDDTLHPILVAYGDETEELKFAAERDNVKQL